MKHKSAFDSIMSCHPDDPAMRLPSESLDDFIARYMSQFQYEETRNVEPTSTDFAKLENACYQITEIINRESVGSRQECYIHILNLAYIIHHAVNRLRQFKHNPSLKADMFGGYVIKIRATLDELLRDSFEDEKRKLEVVFGLVDAVAELLIEDLEVFDLNPDPSQYDDAKTIRKLIANLLTNLVFGNTQSKRRLCTYPGFIKEVTRIIERSPGLAVFYAALIRNLSWQADNPMKQSLSRIVPALASAAMKAHSIRDSKCLLATLSALWNLGSHSIANKGVMCETPGFMLLVISLLDSAPCHTTMVENASGILKYACVYLVTKPALLQKLHDAKLVRQLLNLLNSSSFTVVTNALHALSQLAERDPQTQMKLCKNYQAMTLLTKLRNSVQDDIRNMVKQILTHLNSSSAAGYAYSLPRNSTAMYYSTSESAYSSGGTNSTGMMSVRTAYPQYRMTQTMPTPPFISYSQQQQQNTLPKSMKVLKQEQQIPPHMLPENAQFLRDVEIEAGSGIPESLLATRSGSIQSLTDDIGTDCSWRSSDNTDAPNSVELSPVSESELPDSPTEFAMKQAAMVARQYGHHENRKSFDDGDALYGGHEDDTRSRDEALSRAIVDALPKPSTSRSLQSTPRLPKPIHIIPQPMFTDLPRVSDCTSFDDDGIDYDDSITDEPIVPPCSLPSSSTSDASETTTTVSKNELTSAVTVTKDHRHPAMMNPPPSREIYDAMKISSLLQSPSTLEKLRDASQLWDSKDAARNERDELSDDSYCCSSEDIVALEDLTALPDDVDQAFQAEKVIIDCGSLSRSVNSKNLSKLPRSKNIPSTGSSTSEKGTSVKIGLLSAATMKRLSKSRNPLPMISTKTTSSKNSKSARVSPFNYKEPTSIMSSEKNQNNSKSQKLLVTTV